MNLPERRQYEHYALLEERLDKHAADIELRLGRFFTKALVAFAVIGVACAISLLGFAYTLRQVQHQRKESFKVACVQQNEQHDKAIQKAQAILNPDTQAIVVQLIDQIRPYVDDCDAYAQDRLEGKSGDEHTDQ